MKKVVVQQYLLWAETNVGMPVASWIGLLIATILALIGFLLRDAYSSLKTKMKDLEKRVGDTEKALQDEKNQRLEDMRIIDNKIQDLHLNILRRLDDIKDKFNEFRK